MPSTAAWSGSTNVDCRVVATQPIAVVSLFLDPSATEGLPRGCLVVDVPPLLRELICEAVEVGNEYPPSGPAARLMGVSLDRLHRLDSAPLRLPIVRDKRLQRLTEALLANPADKRSLKDWAACARASERTLERQFVSETGPTFRQEWRGTASMLDDASSKPRRRKAMSVGAAGARSPQVAARGPRDPAPAEH